MRWGVLAALALTVLIVTTAALVVPTRDVRITYVPADETDNVGRAYSNQNWPTWKLVWRREVGSITNGVGPDVYITMDVYWPALWAQLGLALTLGGCLLVLGVRWDRWRRRLAAAD